MTHMTHSITHINAEKWKGKVVYVMGQTNLVFFAGNYETIFQTFETRPLENLERLQAPCTFLRIVLVITLKEKIVQASIPQNTVNISDLSQFGIQPDNATNQLLMIPIGLANHS